MGSSPSLRELVEYLARGLVDHPEEVVVEEVDEPDALVLELKVAEQDLGKVIGRGGRTARALRTVIGSLAGNRHVRIDLLETGEVR